MNFSNNMEYLYQSLSVSGRKYDDLKLGGEYFCEDSIFIGDFNILEYHDCCLCNIYTNYLLLSEVLYNLYKSKQYDDIVDINNRVLKLALSNKDFSVAKSNDILLPEDPHHPALNIGIPRDVSEKNNVFPINNNESFNFREADI